MEGTAHHVAAMTLAFGNNPGTAVTAHIMKGAQSLLVISHHQNTLWSYFEGEIVSRHRYI